VTEATRPAAPERVSDGRPAARPRARERRQGAGLDLFLPYLLLAPSVLTVFGVLVYPLWNGLQTSTKLYRYGRAVSDIGLDNYRRLWSDPEFLNALWITLRFVTIAVAIETVLGFALALFCAKELSGIRLLRTVLIVPMVITPVVVAIVFRLMYANETGMLTALSLALGGGKVEILGDPLKAFIGLIVLDVWEWTPLVFLILLAGLQSLPQEPFEAAQVDGAGAWRTFIDLTLPMMRPILAVAIVLRTIDAFGTFDQVFVLTQGGPGTSTKLISLYGYEVAFKFQQTGYAAALFFTVGLLILALALAAVRLLRRVEAT
jgi:multiple sugar transport system permease protein